MSYEAPPGLYWHAVVAVDGMSELEAAARDMLRHGAHDGPCTNEGSGEACDLHIAASDARDERLHAALAALGAAPVAGLDAGARQRVVDAARVVMAEWPAPDPVRPVTRMATAFLELHAALNALSSEADR